MKKILPLLALLTLSACGGSTATDSITGLTVSFSTSALSLQYNEGDQPQAQIMSANATGTTDKDILIGAEVNGNGIATPINVVVDPASRTAKITVVPRSGLAAGTYNGTIKMLACANQDCSIQHGGSPYTVSYSVTVRPRMAQPSAPQIENNPG